MLLQKTNLTKLKIRDTFIRICNLVMPKTDMNPLQNARPYILFVSMGIVVLIFSYSRWELFLYQYLPLWCRDSSGYLQPVEQILNGQIPLFDLRTPGYPIFLTPILLLGNINWIPIAQMIISLASALFLTYFACKILGWWALAVVWALCAYLTNPFVILFEMSIRPDSLLASGNLFMVGCIFLFFIKPGNRTLLILISFFIVLVFVKPSGLYYLPSILFCGGYLIYKKGINKKVLFVFSVFPGAIIVLCMYNLLTFGQFSINPFSVTNFLGATSTSWAESSSFDKEVNEVIAAQKDRFTKAEKMFLGKDLKFLWKNFNKKTLIQYGRIYYNYFDSSANRGYFLNNRDVKGYKEMGKVAKTALKESPDNYIRFFIVGLALHYYSQEGDDYFRSPYFYYKQMRHTKGLIFEKYYSGYLDDFKGNGYFLNEKIMSKYKKINIIHSQIYRGNIYIKLYFGLMAAAFLAPLLSIVSIKSSLIYLLISSVPIFSAVLVSLCQIPLYRYIYPTEVIMYLAIALTPLLFTKVDSNEARV